MAGIVGVALVFGILLEQVVLARSAYELWDVRKEVVAAEATHEELLLEAARLQSPGRIERFARERLGMIDPLSVEYIVADIPTRTSSALARAPRAPVGTVDQPASAQGLEP